MQGGNLIILSVALDEFKRELNNEFECKDCGLANHFLGFDILHNRPNKQLFISQELLVLLRFDMDDINTVKQPLPTGFQSIAATDEEHEVAKHLPYAKVVRSILRFDSKAGERVLLGYVDADWGEA